MSESNAVIKAELKALEARGKILLSALNALEGAPKKSAKRGRPAGSKNKKEKKAEAAVSAPVERASKKAEKQPVAA